MSAETTAAPADGRSADAVAPHVQASVPANALDVGEAQALPMGARKLVFLPPLAAGLPPRSVLLLHTQAGLFALDNSCPHQGAALAGGKLDGALLSCPAHGLRFDIGTGQCVGGGLQVACWTLQALQGRLWLSQANKA